MTLRSKVRLLLVFLLFALLPVARGQAVIFIVRHAEKQQGGNDPSLSPAGQARADALVPMLKDARISAIYATGYRRTREMAAPLAHALKLPILESHAPWRELSQNQPGDLSPAAANMAELAQQLRRANQNALVVGHTNTIPDLVRSLGIQEKITIPETDYDDLFLVISGNPPRLVHLHYYSNGNVATAL